VGTTWVMFVNPKNGYQFDVTFGRPGTIFDLKKRKLLN
jgi:hypothetical protein